MKKITLILWALIYPQLILSTAFAQGPQKLCYLNGFGCSPAVQASNSVKIDNATATTVELVALISNKAIFVTSFNVNSAGTGTIKFVYGTGTNCGTGTTDLTGVYSLVANGYISAGDGQGSILFVPRSNALCITTTGSVQRSGSVSYTQF